MKTFSLVGFAAFAIEAAAEIHKAGHGALEKAAKIVEIEAKAVLGTDGYGWVPLSPNTKKTRPGMLLESGEMQASIEHTVVSNSEAHVGSNNDEAVWQELGTAKIPARSFLGGAAIAKRDEVGHAIGEHIVKVFSK
jgi:phage gpG-like protein